MKEPSDKFLLLYFTSGMAILISLIWWTPPVWAAVLMVTVLSVVGLVVVVGAIRRLRELRRQ